MSIAPRFEHEMNTIWVGLYILRLVHVALFPFGVAASDITTISEALIIICLLQQKRHMPFHSEPRVPQCKRLAVARVKLSIAFPASSIP